MLLMEFLISLIFLVKNFLNLFVSISGLLCGGRLLLLGFL